MKDFLEVVIKSGDTVVYPYRKGTTFKLRKAIVYHVDTEHTKISLHLDNGKRSIMRHPERLVVVNANLPLQV